MTLPAFVTDQPFETSPHSSVDRPSVPDKGAALLAVATPLRRVESRDGSGAGCRSSRDATARRGVRVGRWPAQRSPRRSDPATAWLACSLRTYNVPQAPDARMRSTGAPAAGGTVGVSTTSLAHHPPPSTRTSTPAGTRTLTVPQMLWIASSTSGPGRVAWRRSRSIVPNTDRNDIRASRAHGPRRTSREHTAR